MASYIIPVLASALCFALLFLTYKWAWSADKSFVIRRILLWLLPVISVIMPLIPWNKLMYLTTKTIVSDATLGIYGINLMDIIVFPTKEASIDYFSVTIFILYIGGIITMVGYLFKELYRVFSFVKNAKDKRVLNNGAQLILIDRDIAPFSCFNYVVMSCKDYQDYPEEILRHELAHIHYKHSIDMVYANIIICLQWFNPAAWLLKREFQILHEYQADNAVLQRGINAQKYQLLLIKRSVGEQMFNLGNSFNYGHLKKRINMMLKKKSHKWLGAKLLLIVPVLLFMGVVFGCNNTENSGKDLKEIKSESIIQNEVQPQDRLLKVAEMPPTSPAFPGGLQGLMEYLSSNVKYPKEAEQAAIEGRVVLRFIVEADGSIKDVTVLKSADELLDVEAIRVVENMPKWEPGKLAGKPVPVYFTLPIMFKKAK